MVEEKLQTLESLLAREEEILQQLPALEPGGEMNDFLSELSGSLQQFQSLLLQIGEADLSNADSSTLGRLKELKQKRDQNASLLQKVLQHNGEKMAAMQLEKKTLKKYRPTGSGESRFVDGEG